MGRVTSVLVLALLAPPARAAEPAKPSAAQLEFFEAKVRPLLVEHCVKCHGDKKEMAGLRLDTAAGLKKGSDNGPAVVPGDPVKSALVKAVRRETDNPMPPNKPLPPEAVAVLTEWVKAGAAFPDTDTRVRNDADAAKAHWAFQPVKDPPVPAGPTAMPPIDRFVLAKLNGQPLAPPADKRTLLRRVSIDVTGLPPTAAEVEAFEKDTSPTAFDRVVDRLLASPRYGERWARHWLDLARYSDTKGYVFQEERAFPYSYTFRDYVIHSLNADTPYNRFVVEQLAADKLDLGNDKTPLAGMGLLTLGRRFLNNTHDIIDDRMDVVFRGLMGLTVSCARCHDHKFDPIPIADYYSLYGVFASAVEPKELPRIGEAERTRESEEYAAQLRAMEQTVADTRERLTKNRIGQLQAILGPAAVTIAYREKVLNRADRNEITNFQKRLDKFRADSPFTPPRAMVLADAPNPFNPFVFTRGNPGNRGPNVPRQFLHIASPGQRAPYRDGGRLQMAEAIASADNPLTARVIVNRVWQHHFGQGIVRTPSDFGTRGDPPTHPELLDWLAKRFVTDDGWSLKKLHRRILLSATYQQSSRVTPEQAKADPENRLLSRFPRRRLDFESLRDSMLAAAGTLDTSAVGGRSVDLFKSPFPKRRSVYGQIDRQNLPGTFRAFDVASPDAHTPQRFQTTVPQQALFLMNSPFVAEVARAVAARPEVTAAKTPAETATAVYRAVIGRGPSPAEIELAGAFVSAVPPAKEPKHLGPWEQFAQVLLLSNEFAFTD